MSAPVLTLSTASSPASSSPYISSSSNQGTPPTNQHNLDPDHHPLHALVALSRNASVISTSSSSSSSSSVTAPVRPRPIRTFSRDSTSTARARSPPHAGYPRSPTTPTRGTPIPAAYLPRALSPDPLRPGTSPPTPTASRPASRTGSRQPSRAPNNRSRSNSTVQLQQQRALTADDFDFGEILGTGSYSSVSFTRLHFPFLFLCLCPQTGIRACERESRRISVGPHLGNFCPALPILSQFRY